MDGDGDEDEGDADNEDGEILTDQKEQNLDPCDKVEQKMKIECQATMSGQVERLQNSETVP